MLAGLAVLAGYHCNLAKNKALTAEWSRDQVAWDYLFGPCSNSFVRPRSISVVPSVAAAIFDVGLDASDHYLDCEHYPRIRPMALARTGASVGGASRLGDGAGIRMRGDCRRDYFHAPDPTVARGERQQRK